MTYYNNKTTDEVARQLWEAAARRGLVTYESLYDRYQDTTIINQALAEITQDTITEAGVMLTAIVISKRDGFPGEWFFRAAKENNRAMNDRLEFWVREVAAVHEYADRNSFNQLTLFSIKD